MSNNSAMQSMPMTPADRVRRRIGGLSASVHEHESEYEKGSGVPLLHATANGGGGEWKSPFRMLSMGLETESQKNKIKRTAIIAVICLIVVAITTFGPIYVSKGGSNPILSYFGWNDRSNVIIRPNDLYGMHDILMTGYAAPFLREGSEGKKIVRRSAIALARQLTVLHPFAKCRDAVREVSYTPQAAMESSQRAFISRVAEAAWSCLPASYTRADFEHPFVEHALTDTKDAIESRRPSLIRRSAAGTCRHSSWDRTCSVWASIHAASLEAEAQMAFSRANGLPPLHVGVDSVGNFLKTVLTLFFGGITQCRG